MKAWRTKKLVLKVGDWTITGRAAKTFLQERKTTENPSKLFKALMLRVEG